MTRLANKNNRLILPFGDIDLLTRLAADNVRKMVEQSPATSLALERGRNARAALALIPIDNYSVLSHTPATKQGDSSATYSGDKYPPSIDARWMHQLEVQASSFAKGREYEDVLSDSVEFATRLRSELLAETTYVDATVLIEAMTRPEIELVFTAEFLDLMREWKLLFAVKDHERWLYPTFQFEGELGVQHPLVHKVNTRFDDDESEWTVLSWWLTPHALLNGITPAAAIHRKGLDERVIDAIENSLN